MTSNMVFGEKNVGVIGGMGPDATADTLAPYRKKIETALSKKGTNKTKIPSLEKDVHKKSPVVISNKTLVKKSAKSDKTAHKDTIGSQNIYDRNDLDKAQKKSAETFTLGKIRKPSSSLTGVPDVWIPELKSFEIEGIEKDNSNAENFEDWPELERRRQLWRLWLVQPEIRQATPYILQWRNGVHLKGTKLKVTLS